jgi:hypothetical protein
MANINQTLGIHPKIETVNTEHSESLKSRKRWLSALSNVGPYIYDVKISGFTRSSIYI